MASRLSSFDSFSIPDRRTPPPFANSVPVKACRTNGTTGVRRRTRPLTNGGFEGLAAVERGERKEWHRIALIEEPRDKVAGELAEVLEVVENKGTAHLFRRVQREALIRSEQNERNAVKDNLLQWLDESGLSRVEFSSRLGTSQSRLSTYLSGKVVPSAALMLRAQQLARRSKV